MIKKNQNEILQKLGIEKLNPMQEATQKAVLANDEVILLSPTGSGKTLAFLLPLMASLTEENSGIQLLVVVPTRELALQIAQTIRQMGTGIKVNAFYGGRPGAKDRAELVHPPAALVGTPGRIAAHLENGNINAETIHSLVLDEFDKSLEIGFESEMEYIVESLVNVKKKVLTSATFAVKVPGFVQLKAPQKLNFLKDAAHKLVYKSIELDNRNYRNALFDALCNLGGKTGIIFCNFKQTVDDLSEFLTAKGIPHGSFHGDMEQHDRERALIQFANGTYVFLLATDLASRGLDIADLDFILHYQLPETEAIFIHRNGRTARMNKAGTVYWFAGNETPEYKQADEHITFNAAPLPKPSPWTTLFISGGRKDKISRGDIVGFMLKQGGVTSGDLGKIDLLNDCAFVAVTKDKAAELVKATDRKRLKKNKVRVREIY